jgi:hypothetical protein
LHITGWQAGGGGASVKVYAGSWTSGTYGVGAFKGTLGGQQVQGPMYCLDLFHSFHFGDTWEVLPIVVPPDPPFPPPFNTGEATWLFNRYGDTSVAHEAQGVQLALWEVSHDQQWRSRFLNPGGWYADGNFQRVGSGGLDTKWSHANQILTDLYNNYAEANAGNAVYLQPTPYTGNEYYGQGQMQRLVPEPGSILALGLGLLGIAGASLRRRRNG